MKTSNSNDEVNFISKEVVDDGFAEMINTVVLTSGICSLVIGAILLLCILFCCTGCCTCCCCRSKYDAEKQGLLYV